MITNIWSYAVIPYQRRTSTINWDDFEIGGTGADKVGAGGKTNWSRVVEETQVSNASNLIGLVTAAAAAVAAGVLARNSLKTFLK